MDRSKRNAAGKTRQVNRERERERERERKRKRKKSQRAPDARRELHKVLVNNGDPGDLRQAWSTGLNYRRVWIPSCTSFLVNNS